MAFHFLDKDKKYDEKNYNYNDQTKTGICRSNMILAQERHVLKLERIQRIATNMVPELEDLTYEERLKEIHLTILKERRERGDLITLYKLMNNLEETDRKVLILRKKGEAKNLRGHKKKLQKKICLNDTQKYSFLQRSIDTWDGLKTEVIMAKKCTSTEGKTGQI